MGLGLPKVPWRILLEYRVIYTDREPIIRGKIGYPPPGLGVACIKDPNAGRRNKLTPEALQPGGQAPNFTERGSRRRA